uniref:Uncharacterized protein n=2 Tax=Hemiselmis andersenii TaxID=464988 RepID=A0A6U2EH88_HEMAN|mmetsp:Transcript_27309/g.63387  ORF Transcript_27309/g.63387 Transcript_27309/m.63387 type:complete len:129 (+) Transcript_27309:960-1346(+)
MFHISSGVCGFEAAGADDKHECKDPDHCKSLKTKLVVSVLGLGGKGSPPEEVTVEAFACDDIQDVKRRVREAAMRGRSEGGAGGVKRRAAPEGTEDVAAEIARLAGEMEDGGRAVLEEMRKAVNKKRK